MNITLIGMAGVGKSTIGQELAKALTFKFTDIDERIETKFKQTLQQIVDRFGEEQFIRIEEEAILDLGDCDRLVISPGGSVVYLEKAMDYLQKRSLILFLDASFESIRKRISNESTRGIIGLKNRKLVDLFRERRPLYQKYAAHTIRLPDEPDKDAIVREILQKIPGNLLRKHLD